MTIRHLLSHTSGIGPYSFTNPIEYAARRERRKGRMGAPLLDEPGTKWITRRARRVLGMVVEKITKSQLRALVSGHIFTPLGMVDTSYAVPANKQ